MDELIREADKDGDGQIGEPPEARPKECRTHDLTVDCESAYAEFRQLVRTLEEEGGGMRDPNAKAPPPREICHIDGRGSF